MPVDTRDDGTTNEWYQERIKTHIMSRCVKRLCEQGKLDAAEKLVATAETKKMRSDLLTIVETSPGRAKIIGALIEPEGALPNISSQKIIDAINASGNRIVLRMDVHGNLTDGDGNQLTLEAAKELITTKVTHFLGSKSPPVFGFSQNADATNVKAINAAATAAGIKHLDLETLMDRIGCHNLADGEADSEK